MLNHSANDYTDVDNNIRLIGWVERFLFRNCDESLEYTHSSSNRSCLCRNTLYEGGGLFLRPSIALRHMKDMVGKSVHRFLPRNGLYIIHTRTGRHASCEAVSGQKSNISTCLSTPWSQQPLHLICFFLQSLEPFSLQSTRNGYVVMSWVT